MSGSLPCDTPRRDHAGLYPFVSGGHLGRFWTSCNTKKKKCFCVFSFTSPCVGVHILDLYPEVELLGHSFMSGQLDRLSCQILFQSAYQFTLRPAVYRKSCWFTASPICGVWSLAEVLPTECVSLCFWLALCWSLLFLCFLHFLSCERPTHTFCQFSYWVDHSLIDSGLFIYSWK